MNPRRFFTGRNVAVIVAVSVAALVIRPWSTPETRAYRVCDACGMDEAETARLITVIRESRLSREQSMALWRQTAEPLAIQECTQCAEAIADVACEREP